MCFSAPEVLGKLRVGGSASGCPRSVPGAVPSPLCPGPGWREGQEPKGCGQEKGLPELGRGHSAHAGNPSAAGISQRQKEYLREDLLNQLDGGGRFRFLRDTAPAFDSADQIGAASQGSVVVSLNVLPNRIYLPIPPPPSLRNLLRSRRGEKAFPGRRRRMEPLCRTRADKRVLY